MILNFRLQIFISHELNRDSTRAILIYLCTKIRTLSLYLNVPSMSKMKTRKHFLLVGNVRKHAENMGVAGSGVFEYSEVIGLGEGSNYFFGYKSGSFILSQGTNLPNKIFLFFFILKR